VRDGRSLAGRRRTIGKDRFSQQQFNNGDFLERVGTVRD
jgi:hypothetical protein